MWQDSQSPYSPQSSEERASRGVFKWLLHLRFHTPVGRSPDFDGPIVRTCGQEFPNRVPTYTFDKTLMLIQSPEAF
jgi:hypothetical protein